MRLPSFVALLLLSSPAVAQDAQPAQSAEQPKEEKKICRRIEVTGSYLGSKRECRTKADWARLDEQTQQALRRRGNTGSPGSGRM